ncbi:MAG: Cna B-type domain-containing protein, partial [Clostridiales bacterium]|nr:Cna B-type domain-containing protein [Clostridiales bacterium]
KEGGSGETGDVPVNFKNIHGGITGIESKSVKIAKTDDTNTPLSGITFKLQKYNSAIDTFEDYLPTDGGALERNTNTQGEVEFKRLDVGRYKIIEVSNLPNYENPVFSPSDTFEIKDSDTQGIAVSVVNPILTTTTFKVKKVWSDENNQDNLRPDEILVQLKAGENSHGTPVALKEGNDWSHTWTDLPQKANGEDIVYAVEELTVLQGYTTSVDASVSGEATITNSHTPEKIDITGTKTWRDNNNLAGKRPDSIVVNLLADGIKIDSKTVTAKENWTYSFDNLPKYANRKEILYTLSENFVQEYEAIFKGYNVENHYVPEDTGFTVHKVWEDGGNNGKTRPQNIQVQLYANNLPYGEIASLFSGNNWTYTWNNLPFQTVDGKEVNYHVQEVVVPKDYRVSYQQKSSGQTTIVNTLLSDVPKTGDEGREILLYTTLGLLALAGISLSVVLKKKAAKKFRDE